jgi:TPR repeat protein
MNSETAIAAYEQACRRYLEVQSIPDIQERIRQSLVHQAECAAAFAGLQSAAQSLDPEVWFALANAYSRGWGGKDAREEALVWFRKAADAGHTNSMVRLGIRLSRPDPDEAFDWFRRAAALGDASGMIFLGFAYRDGTGVACDYQQAVDWFIKAVEAGDGHAMIYVGRTYSRYIECPSEALRWFLRAADAGYTESHLELAFLYENRKSPLYNAEQAVHWYRKVIDGTSSSRDRAMLALAHFCRNGEGTPHDPTEAKAWLVKVLESAPPKSAFHREAKALLPKWEAEML